MTKGVWFVVILVVGVGSFLYFPRNPCRDCRSGLWAEILSEAEQRGFDYCGNFHAAIGGDESAIDRLIDFSRFTDAGSALGHGCAIVKVIQAVGDDRFAACIRRQTPETRERVGSIIECGIDYGMGGNPADMTKYFPSCHKALIHLSP
jgi:hypothetical protein